MNINISPEFVDVAQSAVERLRYVLNDCSFSIDGNQLVVICEESRCAQVQREVSYALYREKIRVDNMPVRELMFKGLFGR